MIKDDSVNARLNRLLGFLKQDPDNVQLLTDTAHAAFDAGDLETANTLITQQNDQNALSPGLINLRGMISLAQQRYTDAIQDFALLIAGTPEDPVLSFNLAWAYAMIGDHAAANDRLTPEALETSPRAPALKIHMLHHLGLLQEAMSIGQGLVERFPNDAHLMGALSVVALDANETDLATFYSERAAPYSPEATTTLATLQLNAYRVDGALALFDNALEVSPKSPRAWIGKGLGLMASGDTVAAIPYLDRGAELFGTHLGSWIAAGWAHYLAGDASTARARFETALSLDDRFAESHGSLAVMDIMAGDLASGGQMLHCGSIALAFQGLWRKCFCSKEQAKKARLMPSVLRP